MAWRLLRLMVRYDCFAPDDGWRTTMNSPKHTRETQGRSRQEQSIDEMVEETFPASDATQLPGRAAGAPAPHAERGDPRREFPQSTPRTIGNQGVAPATRMREESIPLSGTAVVTFRFDIEARRLSLRFSEDGMMLDAQALDRLIAALSTKRAQMAE
jgi:hypothetical protein